VSMGFEGNRMPADQDRNPTEIPEEPSNSHWKRSSADLRMKPKG
jgi:hypothetical protein